MNGDRGAGENGENYRVEKMRAPETHPGPNGNDPHFCASDRVLPFNPSSTSRHQVVTLAYPSEHLPADLMSAHLAAALWAETNEPTVLVRFNTRDGFGSTGDETQPGVSLNGEFHMPPQIPQTDAGFHSLKLDVSREPPSPAGIASLVRQLSRHFRFVLLAAPVAERPALWLSECLLRSDLTYVFLQPEAARVNPFEHLSSEAQRGEGRTPCIKLVGCMAEGEPTEGFGPIVQCTARPIHLFVHDCPKAASEKETALRVGSTGLFRADVRRLAREISGRLVGLALSSGAAKGFAHVGVIQVLEENGIEVDVIAGSSMGAYVGSLWAYGNNGTELERIAREMEGRWALWSLIDPAFPPRQGFLRGQAVKQRLMRTIGHSNFADLQRPLRIVAGNLATLERVVFSCGEVASAVHASCAVPGVCVPVTIDGETYIDGGIVDPLPVDVLREMGVGRVIAVDVIPTLERIRAGLNAGREPKARPGFSVRRLFRKLFPVNQQLNYFARGNLLEILMRSVYGAQIRVAEASARQADLVLRPNICDDRWLDYRNPGKFIALGREAAERQLDEIKALVAEKKSQHERQPAPETLATTA